MKKLLLWGWNNILFLSTLLLLMFIPLYPKLPLLDVQNTWVYIRAEDFLVFVVILLWFFLFLKRKVSLKTPLTLSILIFWIVGVISTIHGVVFIFPQLSNVFPNVAFLTFLRHLEYISLFFIAYSGMKEKNFLVAVISVLCLTFILAAVYGLMQKFLGLPAYLTMNEEFAKGIPIKLSQLSRVPSTFAGHYDFAAYLVFMIPILASLIFGFKNWLLKIFFAGAVILGLTMLSMTVSRVSFFVLFASLFLVLIFQRKKLVIFLIPVLFIAGLLFLSNQPALFSRFGNTVKEVNVLIDAKTGIAIGHLNYVPLKNFEGKAIDQRKIGEGGHIYTASITEDQNARASPSSFLLLKNLPESVPYVSEVNLSTGENLPAGTGYINLSLSPVTKKIKYFFYEKSQDSDSTEPAQVFIFQGDFLVKRASAYDLSFTTRFQGEWPNALLSFKRNILLGSGYGSVSLAVDNNFLKILGENGLFGIISFLIIFIILGIYIKKILPNVESNIARSFIIGFAAGVVGLFLNATLIDVFEASKIAFLLWMLTGVVLGILVLYQKEKINTYQELKKILSSPYAIISYLFIISIFIFSPMVNNFFVGDDFTWFRWVTDCSNSVSPHGDCLSAQTIIKYFTESNGFFYRPGTKIYFLLMYSVFWFNQVIYHMVSIFLHFTVAALFFLIARKILKDLFLCTLVSIIFLLISGYSEAVFWISSTGYLFTSVFTLSSILFFIEWEETKRNIFFILSLISLIVSPFFHELGIITPLFLILYKFFKDDQVLLNSFKKLQYLIFLIPVALYLVLRYSAQSHWFSGDYSYNIFKLPFNITGNIFGYLFLIILGPSTMPLYQTFRDFFRGNLIIASLLALILIFFISLFKKTIYKNFENKEKRIILFGSLFFAISLLPFLGLGNITSRYSYLASLGLIIVFSFILKKIYLYLKIYGRETAFAGISVVGGVFLLWNIIQIQQIHIDWSGAGVKSKNFFTSIDSLYADFWSKEPVSLHFVNVPIRSGEAWVFPVGLADAIWFAFENKNIKIYIHNSAKEAFAQGGESSYLDPVFVFNDDGSLTQVYRPKKTIPESAQNK